MLKAIANIVSVVFHPLFLPTYVLILLMVIDPYPFGFFDMGNKNAGLLIIRVFFSTFLIPGMAIFMMKMLGLISSFEMKNKQERIVPYIVSGIFFLWIFKTLVDYPKIHPLFVSFLLGATISLFLAFFINLFSKISIHTVGIGGVLGLLLLMMMFTNYPPFVFNFGVIGIYQVNMLALFLIGILIAGLVGTVRLYLDAHNSADLWGGYLVGFIGQLMAFSYFY